MKVRRARPGESSCMVCDRMADDAVTVYLDVEGIAAFCHEHLVDFVRQVFGCAGNLAAQDLAWALDPPDEAALLRSILTDFIDVMGDEPAEADRVALARRLAEALR